jgi:hypothetical protein
VRWFGGRLPLSQAKPSQGYKSPYIKQYDHKQLKQEERVNEFVYGILAKKMHISCGLRFFLAHSYYWIWAQHLRDKCIV